MFLVWKRDFDFSILSQLGVLLCQASARGTRTHQASRDRAIVGSRAPTEASLHHPYPCEIGGALTGRYLVWATHLQV